MSDRVKRVNELLRERVSEHLAREVSHEMGLVTVTAVDTAPDLKHADVWVSFISPDAEKSLELLGEVLPSIQEKVNHELKMKFVPRLHLRLDKSSEYVEHINEIFDDLGTSGHSEA